MKKLSTEQSGIAGEYFVAAELSRRGYLAAVTIKNTKGVDILASNRDATKSVGIQVKTNQARKPEWMLNKKIEGVDSTNLFFVFVLLNQLDQPQYYVVPFAEAARYASENHKQWLATPGKKGQPHNENSIRWFRDKDGDYLGRWDLLGLD
jgi:hypothetical protein